MAKVLKLLHLSLYQVCYNVVEYKGPFDILGFISSMDDIFTCLWTLATYISHQFIHFIEDLILRDISRCSGELFISSEDHTRSSSQSICKFILEECSSSSNSYIAHTVRGRRAIGSRSGLFVNTRFEVIEANCRYLGIPCIFYWLMLPLFELQIAWRLAMASWRRPFYYASVEHNAWELKQYIEEFYWGSGKRVMLLGHSKGGVDAAAAALSMYWSDLKNKVAGLALVQSPYGGTPIASDIMREGQIADRETRRIMEFLILMRILDECSQEFSTL